MVLLNVCFCCAEPEKPALDVACKSSSGIPPATEGCRQADLNCPRALQLRIINAFRFILRTQRPKVPLTPAHIFQPLITSSRAQLQEIDFNLHKSNSSYFADVDIARAHLVCTLFSRGIDQMRGGTSAYTGSKKPLFGLALGAVSCTFKRELRPFEEYEMWSKILAWDEKWIYMVTHFVRKGAVRPKSYSLYPQQNSRSATAAGEKGPLAMLNEKHEAEQGRQFDEEALRRASFDSCASSLSSGSENEFVLDGPRPSKQLFATALSKCVFKSGRKTVSPELMLQMSGLLPVAEEGDIKTQVTLEKIDMERQRGLLLAQNLANENQQRLEVEFPGDDCEALGRHTDGAGIVGVVNTLLQLAHLKKGQIL